MQEIFLHTRVNRVKHPASGAGRRLGPQLMNSPADLNSHYPGVRQAQAAASLHRSNRYHLCFCGARYCWHTKDVNQALRRFSQYLEKVFTNVTSKNQLMEWHHLKKFIMFFCKVREGFVVKQVSKFKMERPRLNGHLWLILKFKCESKALLG